MNKGESSFTSSSLQLSFRTVVKALVHPLKEPEAVTCWQPYTELTSILEATSPNLTSHYPYKLLMYTGIYLFVLHNKFMNFGDFRTNIT